MVLDGELGKPLVVFQSCDDGHEVPEKEEEKTERLEAVERRKRHSKRRKRRSSRSSSSPVLQVDEVLQVELSGVLAQVDGVYILQEKDTNSQLVWQTSQRPGGVTEERGGGGGGGPTHWTSSL